MKKILLFLYLLLPGFANSQVIKERLIWYFGYNSGLDFHTDPPTLLFDGKVHTYEGCAVANDRAGNLLFYTRGDTIFNRMHQPMPNGKGMYGHQSSCHSTFIVAQPSNDDIYLVFNSPAYESTSSPMGLYYSELNMKLDGGLGDVVSGKKNILLFDSAKEKIAGIYHANGHDYWVAARRNSEIICYLITDQGINPLGVRSNVITQKVVTGQFNFSPDGKYLASANYGQQKASIEVYTFNNETGEINNPRYLDSAGACYGIIFSPNSKYLYAADNKRLIQLDPFYPSAASMWLNKKTMSYPKKQLGGMQYSPDNKILISASFSNCILRINEPNNPLPQCGFEDSAIVFPGSNLHVTFTLPSFVERKQKRFDMHYFSACDSVRTAFWISDTVANGISSIQWDFGDKTKVNQFAPIDTMYHSYAKGGKYKVKAIIKYNLATDTLIRDFVIKKPFVSDLKDTILLCLNDSVRLAIDSSGEYSYLWSTGSKKHFIIVADPGYYIFQTNNGYCQSLDSVLLIRDSARFKVDLGKDTLLCKEAAFILDAEHPGASYVWQNGSTERTFEVDSSGFYWVRVKRPDFNCSSSDSIKVTVHDKPLLDLNSKQSLCDGNPLTVDLRMKGYKSLLWQDGTKDSLYSIKKPGIYTVTAFNEFCKITDSLIAEIISKPELKIESTYSFCDGDSVVLNIPLSFDSIHWEDADQSYIRTFKNAGTFKLVTYLSQCRFTDTFSISLLQSPSFSLRDSVLCDNEKIILSPGINDASYVWQDGSTNSEILIADTGLYYVTVSNKCGSSSDSSFIEDCNCIFYFPNAFSPNHNSLNEIFKPEGCIPKIYQCKIYNRWGECIFESNTASMGWDGTYDGKEVSEGVYYYTVTYTQTPKEKKAGKFISGRLLLIR